MADRVAANPSTIARSCLRARLLAALGEPWVKGLSEAEREPLWRTLSDLVARHRKFSQTEWAMAPEALESVSAVADALTPESEALKARPIFAERDFDLLDEDGDYEAQRRRLDERRRETLGLVLAEGGLPAVIDLAASSGVPWVVGATLAAGAPESADESLLPILIDSQDEKLRQFAGGYARGRFAAVGWGWIDGLNLKVWSPNQVGRFFAYLPFATEAWDRVDALLGGQASSYWTQTGANTYESPLDRERAASLLVEHGRPWAAIDALDAAIHQKETVPSALLILALTSAATVESGERVDAYSATNLIRVLQEDPSLDESDLRNVEWLYVPLLDGHHGGATPVGLHRKLASDPAFFCELVRIVFRSTNESDTEKIAVSEDQERVGLNAYRLLDGWRLTPGTNEAGVIIAKDLDDWWLAVSQSCEESGHIGVATDRVGHVLAFSPPDPDGLWIHRAVAALLSGRDLDKMRTGYATALTNARGVFSFTSGVAERELALSYDAKAEAVEAAGFHRLAETLRRVADGYRSDAERDSRKSPFDD